MKKITLISFVVTLFFLYSPCNAQTDVDTSKAYAFPNPFQKTTNIILNVETNTHVDVTIYNLIGQKVAVLYDKYSGPGKLSIEFNANNLTPGIYIYTVKTNEYIVTKKVTLIQ